MRNALHKTLNILAKLPDPWTPIGVTLLLLMLLLGGLRVYVDFLTLQKMDRWFSSPACGESVIEGPKAQPAP